MGSQASADVRPAAGRRRIVHTGWFCRSAWFPNRSRPGLLAYRAREDGRCQPRAEQDPYDLSGLAGRGATPPVAERADDVQPAAGLVEGAGRPRRRSGRAGVGDRAQHPGPGLQQAEPDRPPGPGTAGSGQGVPQRVGQQLRHHDRDVWAALCHAPPEQMARVKSRAARTDPGSAPSAWRSAAARASARGRDPVMAATCRSPGRPSPRPASASGSRRCPPGMTGALPSPPGRCHRASRIGVRTFCDHQVLAGLTGLARCRLAAAASSPGPDRIEDRAAGMGGTGRVSGVSAAGHGLIGRGIAVCRGHRCASRRR